MTDDIDTRPAESPPVAVRIPAVAGRTGADRPPWWRRRAVLAHAAVVGPVSVVIAALWLTRPAMLDTGDVAATIGDRIGQQTGQQVSVQCPDTARQEEGETFTCTVRGPGDLTRTVIVTVTDDEGAYTWRSGG